jgi:YgiT-type zinc finger domain-containing protein
MQKMTDMQENLCEYCDSETGLAEQLVTVYRHRGQQHFIFENVPARVCSGCGHRYYSLDVAEQMEHWIDSPDTSAYIQPVPVIHLPLQS